MWVAPLRPARGQAMPSDTKLITISIDLVPRPTPRVVTHFADELEKAYVLTVPKFNAVPLGGVALGVALTPPRSAAFPPHGRGGEGGSHSGRRLRADPIFSWFYRSHIASSSSTSRGQS